MLNNITRKNVLASDIRFCDSHLSKARGLMFARECVDEAMIFRFSGDAIRPLHMMFVFFSIDVLFLDEKKRVVEMKQDFKPFALLNPKKPSRFVVELPRNTITRSGTCVGDMLRWTGG